MAKKIFSGPSSPKWWQTLQLVKNPYRYLTACKEKYEEPFVLSIDAKTKCLFFSHPDAIRDIFTAHYNNVFASPVNEPLLPVLGSESLLLLDSEQHVKMRRLMTPPFLGKAMKSYGEAIHQIAIQNTVNWEKNSKISIYQAMTNMSLEVILHAVFGLDKGPRFESYKKTLVAYISLFSGVRAIFLYITALQKNFGPFTLWSKHLRTTKKVDELIYEEIAKRKSNPQKKDIFSRLLAVRDEQGNGLSDKELRDQLLTLLAAGYETTAASLAWCFYWIHSNPQVLEKLCQELSSFRHDFNIDAITKLEYLDAVCREVLRLYPVVPGVGRIIQQPMSIMGFEVAAQTAVAVSIYLAHHREDLYPDADVFRPERFLERKFTPYEYLPFGGGARRCLGMQFSLYEMKIMLAYILLNFRLKLCQKIIQPVRRSVTIIPQGDVAMIVKEKLN